MSIKSHIRPSGVQKSKLKVGVMPFDYRDRILSRWQVQSEATEFLMNTFIMEMFPEKKGGRNLFSWESITRNHAITYLSAFHTINSLINKQAVLHSKPFVDVTDEDIQERVERSGVLSPLEIRKRYPLVSKPSLRK
ncbi:MAG: hypothetical protein CBC55_03565 [Gammaproteobacteria bacterium TMED95]|nr:MAG: hypothetical protein CBC55_03565 [Gammaproteobacteria bacterium TMED95]|tara:strand:- start:9801 stop:10208 length:408 start_codon:yes stop_codon:yes gene_type:complete